MKPWIPGCCELCRRPIEAGAKSLCQACFSRLLDESRASPVRCPACLEYRAPLADGICLVCHEGEGPVYEVRSLARYLEPWPGLIQAVKFGQKAPLLKDLGRLMGLCLGPPEKDELVTWVPLSPGRFMLRGFNQAARLARAYAESTQSRAWPLLRRIRGTKAQARLGARGRRHNLDGAFALLRGGNVEGRRILLIDDVVTTGATTTACCALLTAAGAARVRIFSLCCG
ncbi:MAG TPA: phosphoribosyltransferase family protein [Spirochaetota bacterium]|nr:phosphoribosyltransferase family protein [Spirochaetota bacterium]